MTIAILTPSITTGDAVSNDVLGMYQVLRERDRVRIFAEGWSINEPRIRPSTELKSFLGKPDDILIYHYSRGWQPGLDMLDQLRCRKVIKYHNVTPPEFMASYSSDLMAMCKEGRRQLEPIARSNCVLFLSASAYNMRELIAAGAPADKSFVVAPFHHVDRLNSIEADPRVVKQYQNGSVNIFTVGRVAPNKGHVALIQAFAAYHRDYNQNSRLIIVGKEETRLAKYSNLLRRLIRRLGLKHAVSFAGGVSDHELKAYYQVADVFLTTSEHEGFCVPLVEAMAMRVPIAAYASSAIPETVGSAGLVWEERNPYLLAESIDSIVRDKALARGLSAMGWQRYQERFTNERIAEKFISSFLHIRA
jgi:glycosyltransferase involved in cell wall biosynthesis